MTVLAFLDANAAIDYIRECALHKLGMPPTGRKAEALRVRLGQMPNVIVSETACREAMANLQKDLARKLGYPKADTVYEIAEYMLTEYLLSARREDNLDHVLSARKMYTAIRANPSDPRLVKWMEKKGEFVADPVLGSDINDLKILSTSAYYVQFYEVELWTHDMDFTMFAGEIYKTFGLRVVDTYRLGKQFL